MAACGMKVSLMRSVGRGVAPHESRRDHPVRDERRRRSLVSVSRRMPGTFLLPARQANAGWKRDHAAPISTEKTTDPSRLPLKPNGGGSAIAEVFVRRDAW